MAVRAPFPKVGNTVPPGGQPGEGPGVQKLLLVQLGAMGRIFLWKGANRVRAPMTRPGHIPVFLHNMLKGSQEIFLETEVG